MKQISIVLLSTALIIIGCGGNRRVYYEIENNLGHFVFKSTNPDTLITHDVLVWTTDLNESKDKKININFIFSETTPNVEKLEQISTVLLVSDPNGNLKPLVGNSIIKSDFFDGINRVEKEFKNNDRVVLNKAIDWNKVNYSYEFAGVNYKKANNVVTFTCDNDFMTDELPDSLLLKIVLKWENGERTYESVLRKKEYKGRKLNPRY